MVSLYKHIKRKENKLKCRMNSGTFLVLHSIKWFKLELGMMGRQLVKACWIAPEIVIDSRLAPCYCWVVSHLSACVCSNHLSTVWKIWETSKTLHCKLSLKGRLLHNISKRENASTHIEVTPPNVHRITIQSHTCLLLFHLFLLFFFCCFQDWFGLQTLGKGCVDRSQWQQTGVRSMKM